MNKKVIIAVVVAIIGVQAVAFNGDCQTDNGKRYDNCVIKKG